MPEGNLPAIRWKAGINPVRPLQRGFAFYYVKTYYMSAIDIVTKQDLQEFKSGLVAEMERVLQASKEPERRWLKTYDVRKMLGNLSNGTMQTLRNSGMLPYTPLNGLALYEYKDVVALMEKLKIAPPKSNGDKKQYNR